MISSRGTQVIPDAGGRPALADRSRRRFMAPEGAMPTDRDPLQLVERIGLAFRWMQVERLREFDRVPGFTRPQGQP